MNNLSDNQLLELSLELAQSVASEHRFNDFLSAIRKIVSCDAIVLLSYKGDYLEPLALQGLSNDTIGRRFLINDHPRFASICSSEKAVRFPADSPLPDPYDGLVIATEGDLPVHACMGIPLYFSQQLIGVLTLDSLTPNTFDLLSERSLWLLASMASVCLHTSQAIGALEANVSHSKEVLKAMNETVGFDGTLDMVGQSPVVNKLKNEINLVAPSNYSVLIQGESGTGKELVAQNLHQQSGRSGAAFIHINCAALPENLIESELFGHVKGAFTGALNNRSGKFLVADGGTIFLDEIGELPLAAQSKLLRVLQNNEIQPVGQDEIITVDVRVIAATNRDLKAEVEHGRFRADLYHRLNVYPIQVPPLRDRTGDVSLLAGFFIERAKRKLGVGQLKLSIELMGLLDIYHWPGNIRELEHLLSRAALKACASIPATNRHNEIVSIQVADCEELIHLDQAVSASQNPLKDLAPLPQLEDFTINLRKCVDDYQRRLLKNALELNQGNWSKAAQYLSVDRANLMRLAKRLGVSVDKVVN